MQEDTASAFQAIVAVARFSGGQLSNQHRTKVQHSFFSPLPIVSSGPPYQMLDLKLALYLPFLKAMEPGVFIAASDTIEVFDTKLLSSIREACKTNFR